MLASEIASRLRTSSTRTKNLAGQQDSTTRRKQRFLICGCHSDIVETYFQQSIKAETPVGFLPAEPFHLRAHRQFWTPRWFDSQASVREQNTLEIINSYCFYHPEIMESFTANQSIRPCQGPNQTCFANNPRAIMISTVASSSETHNQSISKRTERSQTSTTVVPYRSPFVISSAIYPASSRRDGTGRLPFKIHSLRRFSSL